MAHELKLLYDLDETRKNILVYLSPLGLLLMSFLSSIGINKFCHAISLNSSWVKYRQITMGNYKHYQINIIIFSLINAVFIKEQKKKDK